MDMTESEIRSELAKRAWIDDGDEHYLHLHDRRHEHLPRVKLEWEPEWGVEDTGSKHEGDDVLRWRYQILGAGEVHDSLPDRYGRDDVEKAKAAVRLLFRDALIADAA